MKLERQESYDKRKKQPAYILHFQRTEIESIQSRKYKHGRTEITFEKKRIKQPTIVKC